MFDLRKRSSMTLNSSLEADEFKRVADKRKVKGGAAGDCPASQTAVCSGGGDSSSCGHACEATFGSNCQNSAEKRTNKGSPCKPQVPPKPEHLKSPTRAEAHSPSTRKLPQQVGEAEQRQSPDGGSISSLSQAQNGQSSPSPAKRTGKSFMNGLSGALMSPNRSGLGIRSLPTSPNSGSPSPSKGGIHGCSPLNEKLSPRNLSPLAGKPRTPSPVQGRTLTHSSARKSKKWLGLPRNPSGKMEGRERRAAKSLSVPDLIVCLEETRFPAEKVGTPLKLLQSTTCKGSTTTVLVNQRLNHSISECCLSSTQKGHYQNLRSDVLQGKDCAATHHKIVDGEKIKGCDSKIFSPWNEGASEDGRIHTKSEFEQQQKRKSGPDEPKNENDTEHTLYKIANELLQTERAYVARLHLLEKVFCLRLTEEAGRGSFPPEVVKNIFSNISSIYSFHSQFLLPDLENCISHWRDSPGLGNVLCKHAPFLRMYADYVRNFDQAMELVTTWTERSSAFRNIIQDIQSQEVCDKLTLQHHMLEPVQRVPRYEMLLRDYLKKLPEDNPDYKISQKTLQTISLAATHSNSAIHKAESLKQLLEIYEMVGEEEVINPTSEFLREGRLLKLAARNASSMERHLFLFNNFLLCCTPKFSLVGQRLTVRCRIGVDGMTVKQTSNEDHAYSFQVSGKEKTLELQASSEQDRDEWIKAIQKAIDVFQKKNKTFKLASKEPKIDEPLEELGRRAPRWIRDNEVTVCMKCQEPFNALTRRRHHCRACGCVVCWKCSDNKVPLEYDGNKLNKVCKSCYTILIGRRGEKVDGKRRQTLELETSPESGESVMSGFLLHSDNPQTWNQVWCTMIRTEPPSLCLYITPQDVKPVACIPLLGCSVKDSSTERQGHLCFSLSQSKTTHTFSCESLDLKQSWVAALKVAMTGKVPGRTLSRYDSTTNGSRHVNDNVNDERVSSDEEFAIIGSVASHS